MYNKLALAVAAALLTASCANTSPANNQSSSAAVSTVQTERPAAMAAATARGEITLEQIMSDQQWVARSPESAYWGLDGSSVFYAQERVDSELRDWFHQPLDSAEAHQVPLEKMHEYAYQDGVRLNNGEQLAYTFEGNIFVRDLSSGDITQITRDEARQSQLQALNDGRLAYREGNNFFAVDLASGLTTQVAALKFSKAPEA